MKIENENAIAQMPFVFHNRLCTALLSHKQNENAIIQFAF